MVLLFAFLISGTLNAKITNYFGAYGNIGEWSLLPTNSAYKPSLGVAGGGGAVYEMQIGKNYGSTQFLLQVGLGLSGGTTSFSQSSTSRAELKDQWDQDPFSTPKTTIDYIYEARDRHDKYTDLALQIPIMVGLQHKRFYALAGLKLYPHVLTKSYSDAILTTYGKSAYFDEMRNQPEYQFFTDIPIESNIKTSLNFDMDVSFEMGFRLGFVSDATGFDVPKSKIEYRLAAFFDYGLLDIRSTNIGEALITPDEYSIDLTGKTNPMIDNLKMNDIISTKGFADKVNNLIVGLKFTILFQLPEKGQCILCHDNYLPSIIRPTSRRGMQYEE